MSEPTVEVLGVEKRFGRIRALAGVTVRAAPGVVGLLGPNGAGKTTLLRMLATVLAPDAGQLRLLGRNPSRAADRLAIRRRLGYMPQQAGLHWNFTAFEFVDYVAILKELTDRRARHDEVRRVLQVMGLATEAGRKLRHLSGGMCRRVALAQALLASPSLLVLDEPTAGLDPEQRLRFRETISAMAQRATVVLATHQTEDVAALCQRVVVLHEGVVRFDGTPRELAGAAQGRVWVADERWPGARLSWRTGEGRWRHIGQPPPGAEPAQPTIEDAYLLLVGERAMQEVAA